MLRGLDRRAGRRDRRPLLDRRPTRVLAGLGGDAVVPARHHLGRPARLALLGVLLDEVCERSVGVGHAFLFQSGRRLWRHVLDLRAEPQRHRDDDQRSQRMDGRGRRDRPPAAGRQRRDDADDEQHRERDRDQHTVGAERGHERRARALPEPAELVRPLGRNPQAIAAHRLL